MVSHSCRHAHPLPHIQPLAIHMFIPLQLQQLVYTHTIGFSDLPARVAFLDLNFTIALSTVNLRRRLVSRSTIDESKEEQEEDYDEECEREHHPDGLAVALLELRVVRFDLFRRAFGLLADGPERAIAVPFFGFIDAAVAVAERVLLSVGIVAYALEPFGKTLLVLVWLLARLR